MCPKNNKSLVRYSYSKKFQKLTAPKRLVRTMFHEILQLSTHAQCKCRHMRPKVNL